MALSSIQQINVRQVSRWVLVVFALSWLNMSFQVPAHAAMMISNMADHMQMSATDCPCPPVLCDSVLSAPQQSLDGIVHGLDKPTEKLLVLLAIYKDTAEQRQILSLFSHADLFVLQAKFPPPLTTTILLI
jgi:hypothetical protein